MTYPTQRQEYIEKEFFSDKNTRLDFRKYDVTGHDRQLLEDICKRLLSQRNEGDAVYSYPHKTEQFEPEHGYDNVGRRHEREHLTWYDITDDGITKKLPGVESGFYFV